jgi:uncharacterized Zn finger protein
MPALKITESLIRQNATEKSFQRGKEYARSHAVQDLVWRDQVLQASVSGSAYYRVSIGFNERSIQSTKCSCPYDFGGWCKHIVATLLVAIEQPKIEERPSLAKMLERLDLEQTRKLLHNLVAKSPDLVDLIDIQVELLTTPQKSKSKSSSKSQASQKQPQHPEIDRSPFRRQMAYSLRNALRNDDYNYYEEDPFTDIIDEAIEKAKAFLEVGDSFRTFMMLYAIAEELCNYTEEIENYCGDASDLVYELDGAMAEAILWTDFSLKERQKWIKEIQGTQDVLGTELDLTLAALTQGWDAPHVQAVLTGEYNHNLTDDKIELLNNDWQDLSRIRLDILEAQERFDEYLNFANAYNFISRYVNMLIRLGRMDEAIAAAERIEEESQAFAVAKQLLEHGAEKEALYIANKGLQLQEADAKRYRSKDLAVWTATLAEQLGEEKILLNAKIISFKLQPSLVDYHQIRDLTKDKWNSVKQTLLEYLSTMSDYVLSDRVDIFLEEEMFDQAIAIANTSYCQSSVRLRVMQAVIKINPQWVITKAKALAEDIITRGKSDAYEEAVSWLGQARNGYLELKQEKDWLSYRHQLVEANARKRKLMELVKLKGI